MSSDLLVCLTCFRLRSAGSDRRRCPCHPRRDDDAHSKRQPGEGYIDLCHLCARDTVTLGSRWSTAGCEECRKVNKTVGDALNAGPGGALTLGTHSMMNGVALRGGPDIEDRMEDFADRIMALMVGWNTIGKWCRDEARRLAESVRLKRGHRKAVALSRWLAIFPSGRGASVDALVRYTGTELSDHPALAKLQDARRTHLMGEGA